MAVLENWIDSKPLISYQPSWQAGKRAAESLGPGDLLWCCFRSNTVPRCKIGHIVKRSYFIVYFTTHKAPAVAYAWLLPGMAGNSATEKVSGQKLSQSIELYRSQRTWWPMLLILGSWLLQSPFLHPHHARRV